MAMIVRAIRLFVRTPAAKRAHVRLVRAMQGVWWNMANLRNVSMAAVLLNFVQAPPNVVREKFVYVLRMRTAIFVVCRRMHAAFRETIVILLVLPACVCKPLNQAATPIIRFMFVLPVPVAARAARITAVFIVIAQPLPVWVLTIATMMALVRMIWVKRILTAPPIVASVQRTAIVPLRFPIVKAWGKEEQ
jgi:hypothetical protein